MRCEPKEEDICGAYEEALYIFTGVMLIYLQLLFYPVRDLHEEVRRVKCEMYIYTL